MNYDGAFGKGFTALQEQPPDMQDFIASQIMELLANEAAWEASFAKNRDVIERMAQEALETVERGETWSLDELLDQASEIRGGAKPHPV